MGNICSNNNKEKKEYYELFKKKLKKNFDSYFNSNIEYALKKRTFDKIKEENEEVDNKYNLWTSYLLEQLNYENQCLINWKQILYTYIKENNFFNQYIFQNGIFFQEEILNKPKMNDNKNIENIEYHFIDSEPIYSSLENDELQSFSLKSSIRSIDDNKSFFSIHSEHKEKGIDQLRISLTMESIDEFNNNNPELISKYYSYKMKKYIKILRMHLEKENHPIKKIINKFKELFGTQIRLISNACKEIKNNDKLCNEKGMPVIKEIQEFIEIIQVSLKLFYSKSVNFKYFSDEKDEIINLITYIIFNNKNNKKFYEIVYELFKYMNSENIEKLNSKFKKYENITPKDLGIHPKFCLDEETEKYWTNYKNGTLNIKEDENENVNEKNQSTDKSSSSLKKELSQKDILKQCIDDATSENITESGMVDIFKKMTLISNQSIKSASTSGLEKSKNNNEVNIKEQLLDDFEKTNLPKFPEVPQNENFLLSNSPYDLAISFLKRINNYKVPLEKLVIVSYISVLIVDCVDKYWEDKKDEIKPDFLNIDADQIMSIYLYIIYKSGLSEIIVQLDFIKYFTTRTTKQSIFGYYYSTFEGCIRYLLKSTENILKSAE